MQINTKKFHYSYVLTKIHEIPFSIIGAYIRRRQFGVQNDKVQNNYINNVQTEIYFTKNCE